MGRIKIGTYVEPEKVYNYLLEKGVSPNHAAGMIANIKSESNFNYSVVGDKGTSGGLFQHHNSRFSGLKDFSGGGDNWKDWKKQVDFALQEKSTSKYLNSDFESAEEASKWFTINWEIPADKHNKANQRAKNLNNYSFLEEGYIPKETTQQTETSNSRYTTDFEVVIPEDLKKDNKDYLEYSKEIEKVKEEEKVDSNEEVEATIESEEEVEARDNMSLIRDIFGGVPDITDYNVEREVPEQQVGDNSGYTPLEVNVQRQLPTLPSLFEGVNNKG